MTAFKTGVHTTGLQLYIIPTGRIFRFDENVRACDRIKIIIKQLTCCVIVAFSPTYDTLNGYYYSERLHTN